MKRKYKLKKTKISLKEETKEIELLLIDNNIDILTANRIACSIQNIYYSISLIEKILNNSIS